MKRRWMFWLFIVLLCISLVMVGCGDDDADEEEEPPEVPPTSVLNIDVSLFQEADLYRVTTDSLRCPHFDTAAGIVIVWGLLTELYFILPQLAFGLAISQEPVYEGDLKWRWTLGNVEGNNISLYGEILSIDSVQWDMRVTNLTLDDFLWYTGRCNTIVTGGWWQFNKEDSLGDEQEALFVEWERSSTTDTNATLTLINNDIDHEGYGDTLRYHVESTTANVFFHGNADPRPGEWNIIWDIVEYYGSIEYPEGLKSCWDDSLHCIECDSIPTM